MHRTYIVHPQARDRWQISATDTRPGWLGSPFKIGGGYRSRKDALLAARLLAGRTASVVVER